MVISTGPYDPALAGAYGDPPLALLGLDDFAGDEARCCTVYCCKPLLKT